MSRLLYFAIFMMISYTSYSQIKFSEAEIMLHNQYVWRGQKLGTGASIEPSVTFSSGNFSLNTWAAFTFDNSYKEFDLIPSYQFEHFTLTLLDYYIPEIEGTNRYLNFREGESRHSLELTADNSSIEKQRLKWLIGIFFAGDQNEETGNPNYSTYIEVKYPFAFLGIDTEPFVGMTPFRGLYADKFAFVNAGIKFSKELDLKLPFTIPLNLLFISNPTTNQTFVTFGGGIAF
jgi:hypothetical protein